MEVSSIQEYFTDHVLGKKDEVIAELCTMLKAQFSTMPVLFEIYENFTEAEVSEFMCQQSRVFWKILDPTTKDWVLDSLYLKIGEALALMNVRVLWVSPICDDIEKCLATRFARSTPGMLGSSEYLLFLSGRFGKFFRGLLSVEVRFDELLESVLERSKVEITKSSTSVDAIKNTISNLRGLGGISGVGFARPDAKGFFQYGFYDGPQFIRFLEARDSANRPIVSTSRDTLDGNGPTGRMWRSGQTQVCNSILSDSTMDPWADSLTSLGIRSSAAVPIVLDGGELFAGIVIYSPWPNYFASARRLRCIQDVIAVLASRLSGVNSNVVLDHRMRVDLCDRLYSDALEILFQPVISLTDFSIVKVEALARLRNDSGELMQPSTFMGAFGSEEFLYLFDRCLGIGLAALGNWDCAGVGCGLSINMPPQGFVDRRYLDTLSGHLLDSDIKPERLTIELTEEDDLNRLRVDPNLIESFRNLGVALSQDDLGSGYSSLLRLVKFGFHEVKIDQGLVRSSSDPVNSMGLIQHLSGLSHDLGIKVVAEGLESDALLEAAAILGADYGQGYGIACPLSKDEFLAWQATYEVRAYPENPKTTLGALALLRMWSRKLVAAGGLLDRLEPDLLTAELVEHLSNFPNLDIQRRFTKSNASSKTGLTVWLLSAVEEIFNDLLASLPVIDIPEKIHEIHEIHDVTKRGALRMDLDSSVNLEIAPVQTPGELVPAQLFKIFELQSKVLISVSGGASTSELLDEICQHVQALIPKTVVTVMLLDETGDLCLRSGPDLSARAAKVFERITPGPNLGSCANVVLTGAPVFVTDIETDIRWNDLTQDARDIGLVACWSVPIFDLNNDLAGTFAISSFEVRTPNNFYRQLLASCAKVASVVLYKLEQDDAARQRSSRLEKMFQDSSTNKLIYRVSDGAIVEANAHAAGFLGYTRDELTSMVITQINESLSLPVLQTKIANTDKDRSWHGYSYHRLANKELRAVEFEGRLFEDDGELFVYSTFFDAPYFSDELVSERRITGEILDSVSAMVIVVDGRGLITRFNRLAEVVTGYTSGRVIGVPDVWAQWIESIELSRFEQAIASALSTGTAESIDIWHHGRTGKRRLMEVRFVSLSVTSSFTEDRVALFCTDVTDRHHASITVQGQLDFISQIVDVLTNLVFVIDRDGYIRKTNRAVEDFTGASFEQISSSPFYIVQFFAPEAREAVMRWFGNSLAGDVVRDTVSACINKDGERRILAWNNVAIFDGDGLLSQIVVMGTDVTERRFKERQLENAAVVFANSSEAILIADENAHITDVNPAFCTITGFSRDELFGKDTALIGFDLQGDLHNSEISKGLAESGRWSGTSQCRRADGSLFPSFVSLTVLTGAKEDDLQYVIQFADISELMAHQRQLAELAYYDHLTHLPNRTFISKKIIEQMAVSRRSKRAMALVYLDLDNFKEINDQRGHDIGDQVLCAAAERMVSILREVDMVSRIGGDEFVCVLSELENAADCFDILDRLVNALGAPLVLDESQAITVQITASMGVAYANNQDVDSDLLLRRADMLMYEAKRAGGNRYVAEDFPAVPNS